MNRMLAGTNQDNASGKLGAGDGGQGQIPPKPIVVLWPSVANPGTERVSKLPVTRLVRAVEVSVPPTSKPQWDPAGRNNPPEITLGVNRKSPEFVAF